MRALRRAHTLSRLKRVLALAYDAQTGGPVPIPPSERGLQTGIADLLFLTAIEF